MNQPNYEVNILPQLEKACGLDIHKDTIVSFISDKTGKKQLLKEFRTFTEDLHQLVDLIKSEGVENCLMESTGVYWMSLYDLLTKAGIKVTIANPLHIKQIPKRKTDKKDARWLCMLLLNGLVRPSFVPERTQQQLREYCRMRTRYTNQRTQALNRIVRMLEQHNIKIRSVVSNVRTKSSMNIIRLLSQGETDIEKFIACCKGRLKKKIPRMIKALQGCLNDADRQVIKFLLGDIDHLDENLKALQENIQKIVEEHYQLSTELLTNISGIGSPSAQTIISEIGDDMNKFPSADHLTSWCGLAPGNHESAGKRKNTATKKGNKYLRSVLIAVAWGAVRTKNSYWRSLYYHLIKRMKPQKAITAIARRLLKVVYTTIKQQSTYQEKGSKWFFELQVRNREFEKQRAVANNLQKQLATLQKAGVILES